MKKFKKQEQESLSDDIAKLYLKDIYDIPLLTEKEEKEITKTIYETKNKIISLVGKIPFVVHKIMELGKSNENKLGFYFVTSNEFFTNKKIKKQEVKRIKKTLEKIKSLKEKGDYDTVSEVITTELKPVFKYVWQIVNRHLRKKYNEYKSNPNIIDKGILRIYFGNYFESLDNFFNEIDNLFSIYLEARNKIILSNQRLIISCCKPYLMKGINFNDLISEGNRGLMEAIERFDYTKNTKFSTYSTYWILAKIKKFILKTYTIYRVSEQELKLYTKIKKFIDETLAQRGEEPSVDEISHALSVKPQKISYVLIKFKNYIELDKSYDDDEGNEEAWNIADEKQDEIYRKEKIRAIIDEVLNTLSPSERILIIKIFGLDGNSPVKLNRIAKELGISYKKAKEIYNRAISKMKNDPLRYNKLRMCLELI
jgi:RNA polymerase primary sigma factor